MPKSRDRDKGYGHSKQLEELDKLLEPDWDESSTTINVNVPSRHHSISDSLKHMNKKKKAGIGAGIVTVVVALVELARQLGWLG